MDEMNTPAIPKDTELIVSKVAENLVGSEIIKLASEIIAKINSGEKVYNLTIGDFNPQIFPIPDALKLEIIDAYNRNQTNYPAANGLPELREAVSRFIKRKGGLDYKADQVLVSAGARPLIYATYKAILDKGDTVVFPVPSWNNNHYTHLSSCEYVVIETTAESNFMPTAADIKPHIDKANLIALCSPLNPTGTVFSKKGLSEICDLIVAENEKRKKAGKKPVYLMFDQIYWNLTFGENKHYDPVSLNPDMKNYTIFIDGISKAFAATGVRVGWSYGPQKVMDKMRAILSHIGAWSPRAEQTATAAFLNNDEKVDEYLDHMIARLEERLVGFYNGIQELKSEGLPVDVIAPQGALYLTIKFKLHGYETEGGYKLETTKDITQYLLEEAQLGLVPFYAFGAPTESVWYRLSVGTSRVEDIEHIISLLRTALLKLTPKS